MSVVDWIIVVILAGSVLAGLVQGFLRSISSLGGLVLGLILASWNYDAVAEPVKRLVHNSEVANAIGFLLIALLVTAIAALLGAFLSKALHRIGLGCLDSLAGGIFGFFQGALLVTVFILVTVAFFPATEWLTQSRLPRYFFGAIHISTHVTPKILGEQIREELRHLEGEAPSWMHPGKPER